MDCFDWAKKIDSSVVICNTKGIVIYVNEEALNLHKVSGKDDLIGKEMELLQEKENKNKIKLLLQNQLVNTYICESDGNSRLITQSPWYNDDDSFGGIVEITINLDNEITYLK